VAEILENNDGVPKECLQCNNKVQEITWFARVIATHVCNRAPFIRNVILDIGRVVGVLEAISLALA